MTSEFKGTAGEWGLVDIEERKWRSPKLVPAKCGGILPVSLLAVSDDETAYVFDEHDARLFAASKRLLEALIEAKCWLQRDGTPEKHGAKCETLSCVEGMIDSAINKALGDENKETNAN